MHLRMFVLSVLLLLSCAPLKATGLDGDVIYIEGEEWELLNKPIEWDSTLFVRLMEFFAREPLHVDGQLGRIYRSLGGARRQPLFAALGSMCTTR